MPTLFLLACFAAAGLEPVSPLADAPATSSPAPAPPASPRPRAAADDPIEGAVEVFKFGFEQDEDRDFDRHPDGWIRRKGRDFSRYIEGSIDRERGHGGKGASLCFKA